MLSAAQVAKINEIRNAPGFLQDCNDPELNAANRAKPAPAPYIYIDADGMQNVRIGVSGNFLSLRISD
jgi:hypothetical protein